MQDNYDQLVKIAKVLGTDDLFAYVEKYGYVAKNLSGVLACVSIHCVGGKARQVKGFGVWWIDVWLVQNRAGPEV